MKILDCVLHHVFLVHSKILIFVEFVEKTVINVLEIINYIKIPVYILVLMKPLLKLTLVITSTVTSIKLQDLIFQINLISLLQTIF